MLLVDHDEAEILKIYGVLNQRVRADDDLNRAALQAVVDGALVGGLHAARQQREVEWRQASFLVERSEQLAQVLEVLLGQNFGRGHQRGLRAQRCGHRHAECGDDGLAAAHVALQQAVHRVRLRDVFDDRIDGALLCAGERVGQGGDEFVERCCVGTQFARGFLAPQLALAHDG